MGCYTISVYLAFTSNVLQLSAPAACTCTSVAPPALSRDGNLENCMHDYNKVRLPESPKCEGVHGIVAQDTVCSKK